MERGFRSKGLITENLSDDTILLTGFEHCISGVVDSFHGTHVVYDGDKIIETIMVDNEMSIFDAHDYFDYNIKGGFFGNCLPLFEFKDR